MIYVLGPSENGSYSPFNKEKIESIKKIAKEIFISTEKKAHL